MANQISLDGVLSNLSKTYKTMSVNLVHKRAYKLYVELSIISKTWQEVIRERLMVSASTRGYDGKKLKPHNTIGQNGGMPMSVSGDLARSIWQSVTISNIPTGSIIRMTRGFNPVEGTDGSNYGNILNKGGKNKQNMVLKNFKERAYKVLDSHVRALVKRGRFA